jgi:uncharacterized protein
MIKSYSDYIKESLQTVPQFRKDGELSINGIKFDFELAEDHEMGLMYRLEMLANCGMLFAYEAAEPTSFWMKNTYISLDIIFIDENNKIINICKNTTPKSTKSLRSERPAMYILEINAGLSDKYGIKSGDKVDFMNFWK